MENLRFRQIHLDFHTSEKITAVGQDFDPKEFVETLKKAHVNSINLFARCHHGYLYYDSKFPNKHPGLKRDLLREQVEACQAAGIRTPIYITVGFDEYMAAQHPEWVEKMPDGKPYGERNKGAGPFDAAWKILCFNTPYIDYVEEQTIEVLERFGPYADGLWFDIIFQDPCCCTYCMNDMLEGGLDPEKLEDRKKFANNVVNRFKKRITAVVRKVNKDCLIFYNSGHISPMIRDTLDTYTHIEIESLASGLWGYEHFPTTVPYAKNLGKDYLAMTGKFHKSWADFGGFKNQPALEYECFTALAHGAKCSIGDQLHPTGKINKATYELIGSVYKQVEEREPWCDNVVPVREIAILTPEAIGKLDGKVHPSMAGVTRMLTEAHYHFDIVDCESDFECYPVLILPDVITMEDSLKKKLSAYIAKGGKVLLSYKSGLDTEEKPYLLEEAGVRFVSEAEYSPDYVVAGEAIAEGLLNTEYIAYERGAWVEAKEGTEVLASIWNPYFNRTYKHFCSHAQTPVEKDSGYPAVVRNGNVVYFSHPIFNMYATHGVRAYKLMFLNSLKLLQKDKVIVTSAPTTAHITLNYQTTHDRYVCHILHYIPERRAKEIEIIEDVIPLYNMELKVKLPSKPVKVYCAPSGQELDFAMEEGYIKVVVPEVVGYQMVVLE